LRKFEQFLNQRIEAVVKDVTIAVTSRIYYLRDRCNSLILILIVLVQTINKLLNNKISTIAQASQDIDQDNDQDMYSIYSLRRACHAGGPGSIPGPG
jgi:DNA relaxase NicK